MENKSYTSTRIWEATLHRLRLAAGVTGETIVSLLDRLSNEEIKRLKKTGEIDRAFASDDEVRK